MTREMNQKKGQVVHDLNMFPQVLESEMEQLPTLPLWIPTLGMGMLSRCFESLDQGFGDQPLFKLGPCYIVQNNLEK
jgi:hypothetical protein